MSVDGTSTDLTADPSSTATRRFTLAALVLGVGSLWVLPLRGSLWMDELGTYWVIKDGFHEVLDRAWHIQGQSPLYYMVEWIARKIGGRSEFVLRLPSLVAMTLAGYLFYRLARRLIGEEPALIATVIFAIAPMVGFFAGDARPYAMATLCVVASSLFLVRWIDSGRAWDGIGYIVFAALTLYVHYIFGLVLLSHAAYAYVRRDRVRLRGVLFALSGTGALVAPMIPQLLLLLDRSNTLSVPAGSARSLLLETVAPPALIAGAFLGLLISHWIEPIRLRRIPADGATLALGAGWLLFAPVTLFAVSTLGPVTLFADRYLVTAAPGFALLAAAVLCAIAQPRARTIVLFAALGATLLISGTTRHTGEDWRGALTRIDARSAGPSTPILVHGGLIEAKQISWLKDPVKASYLNGPTTYYGVVGKPYAMPYLFNDASERYLEDLLPTLRASHQFFYVTRYPSIPTPQWLLGRLEPDGFRSSVVSFGKVKVFEFRRD